MQDKLNYRNSILSEKNLPFFEEDVEENIREYLGQMQLYNAGIKEIKTKLEILDDEFRVRYDYNPIHHIESRLKSPKSILEKLERKDIPVTIASIKNEISDIAGVRVICNYIDDINTIANLLIEQNDIKLIKKHDYIENPKENGYRSLHLVIEVPIFLSSGTCNVAVEIQIRTIAMDFWASLEHKLKYKTSNEVSDSLRYRLKKCAEDIAAIDEEMQQIHREIDAQYDDSSDYD